MNRETPREFDPRALASGPGDRAGRRIDEVLRRLGSAAPESGLEGRILTRLAAARLACQADPVSGSRLAAPRRLPRLALPVLGLASMGVLCAVIVGGSVSPSRRSAPLSAPPVLQLPGQGIGAASAVRPAAPASTPVPADTPGRGRSAHRDAAHGRARIAPHARKAPGVVVPAPSTRP